MPSLSKSSKCSEVAQGRQHKAPAPHAGVRQDQLAPGRRLVAPYQVADQQEVDVEGPWTETFPVASAGESLERLHLIQDLIRVARGRQLRQDD